MSKFNQIYYKVLEVPTTKLILGKLGINSALDPQEKVNAMLDEVNSAITANGLNNLVKIYTCEEKQKFILERDPEAKSFLDAYNKLYNFLGEKDKNGLGYAVLKFNEYIEKDKGKKAGTIAFPSKNEEYKTKLSELGEKFSYTKVLIKDLNASIQIRALKAFENKQENILDDSLNSLVNSLRSCAKTTLSEKSLKFFEREKEETHLFI